MAEILYPGVFLEEVPAGVHPIEGVSTSTTAFIGATARGPFDRAVLVGSWADYEADLGDACGLLDRAVRAFFGNGGRAAFIAPLATATPDALAIEGALAMLDAVDLDLLCAPGECRPEIVLRLETYCDERRAFLIADADPAATPESLAAGLDPSVEGEHATNAALYYPWLLPEGGVDPVPPSGVDPIAPSGAVAGVFARVDAEHGIWKAPAGAIAELRGFAGPAVELDAAKATLLEEASVNVIRTFPGIGTTVWGARTLASHWGSDWNYVSVRRLALFIEKSIDEGTSWAVFEPNDETLWSAIRASAGAFLQTLWRLGAFQGGTPEKGYFLHCDATTTSSDELARGIVNLEIGFAPLRPAEFIVLRIPIESAAACGE